jgi:hypothetical protein
MSRTSILAIELEARLSKKQDELDMALKEIEVTKQENQVLLMSLKENQNNVAANHEGNINTTIPIDLAANFLPNSVVSYVSTGEALTKPFHVTMEDTTLLFLDISGYTKLGEFAIYLVHTINLCTQLKLILFVRLLASRQPKSWAASVPRELRFFQNPSRPFSKRQS